MENINDLVSEIIKYRDAYWNGETLISDAEYDSKIEELRKIDSNHPILHTIEHGKAISMDKQIIHEKPMLSLNKVYNKDDLMEWIKHVSRNEKEIFLIQPKYDGISCHYDKGIYSTRGDGNIGENITNVCVAMCNHQEEDGRKKIDFYGEIVIKKSDFKNIYSKVFRPDGNLFKNSRNAVAGILGNDDYMYYANQGAILTLIDYDKYSFESSVEDFEKNWDVFKGIINTLDYPMDGIVIKIKDKEYAESLGYTAHHPKGAIAFKFENASAETVLLDVEYGMGKENITAIAVFEPIELNGVTISKAVIPMNSKNLPNIYNGDFRKGSKIIVERAGDVIPHIIKIETNSEGELFFIDKCPFCNSEIEIADSAIKCKNDDCRKKLIHKLYDALTILGIKNIGEKNVDVISEYILEKNGLKINLDNWMSCIVKTNYCFEALSNIPRFGAKSAQNIINETQKIRETSISKLIAALGIPNVGIKIGNELEKFGNILDIVKLPEDVLANIDGIGTIMAKRLHEIFVKHEDEIIAVASHFKFKNNDINVNKNKETICFTGAMTYSRSQMSKFAIDAGYDVIDSVTKNLNILVVADNADFTSSKCVKALKYGTKVIKEMDFFKLIKK